MAMCDVCETEMLDSPSCITSPIELLDGFYDRIAYGSERAFGRAAARRGPCGDCGVLAAGIHHLGCDLEECPRCGGQFFSCNCHPPDEDDADDWSPSCAADLRGGPRRST